MDYTPGQVSDMLNIPSSTLRRYVAKFGNYLTDGATRQRGRLFSDGDLNVIMRIRDLAAQGVSLDNIAEQIEQASKEAGIDKERIEPETAITIIDNRFKEVNERISDYVAQVNAVQKDQIDQAAEIDELREMVNKLSADLDAERQRSIWSRLFKRDQK